MRRTVPAVSLHDKSIHPTLKQQPFVEIAARLPVNIASHPLLLLSSLRFAMLYRECTRLSYLVAQVLIRRSPFLLYFASTRASMCQCLPLTPAGSACATKKKCMNGRVAVNMDHLCSRSHQSGAMRGYWVLARVF